MSDDPEIIAMRKRMHDLNDLLQVEVTRNATMSVNLANLVSMVTEHKTDVKAFMADSSDELRAIREQVTKTNGTVLRHEDHFTMNDREIKALKDTMVRVVWSILGLFGTVLAALIIEWVKRNG
jgi:hypothetical protein